MNKSIFTICKQLNDYQYFAAATDPSIITWDDVADYFLPHTQQHVELFKDLKKLDIPQVNHFYQDRDYILHNIAQGAMFCVRKFWNVNYKTQTLWDEIVDEHPYTGVDFHLYGGLTESAQSFPPHNDLANNYIVQLDGSCEWTIYNERATVEQSKNYVIYPADQLTVRTVQVLNPGDVLYIPQGLHHNCRPLGKRLSLSIPLLAWN